MDKEHIDQMNRLIKLNQAPKRIVSVVPSQSELLVDLGLLDKIAGVTKFCEFPKTLKEQKPQIGGTKNLNIEKIKSLEPDLILANKEENTKDQILELSKKFPVWVSDVKNLSTAIDMVKKIGVLTYTVEKAEDICLRIRNSFKLLKYDNQMDAAYLIWRKPYMSAGGDTFINNMLGSAGFRNIFCNLNRYPETNLDLLSAKQPEVILLSSEPYPFGEKHKAEIQQRCPNSIILLVDGTYFSWYGSRLAHSPKYFKEVSAEIKKIVDEKSA